MNSERKNKIIIISILSSLILISIICIILSNVRNRNQYDEENEAYSIVESVTDDSTDSDITTTSENIVSELTEDATDSTEEFTDNSTEEFTESTSEETSEEITEATTEETTENEEDWCLILVNADNPVPDDYNIELTDLSNGKQVDSRIYPQLQAMFDNARSSGLDLFVREGYRTREDQQAIMDNRVASYIAAGNSEEDAKKLALEYVAIPGTSEHELGISVDINANNNISTDDAVYSWLNENAYKYGFIKRYPENKIDITKINNEPWHYRYVGKKAAKEMKENDMCLEEYLTYISEGQK